MNELAGTDNQSVSIEGVKSRWVGFRDTTDSYPTMATIFGRHPALRKDAVRRSLWKFALSD